MFSIARDGGAAEARKGLAKVISASTATKLRPAADVERPSEVLATGLAKLDALLPDGGVPRGQLSEISGGRSCGKRALACALVARTLRQHERAVWIDGSGGFYPLLPLEFGVPLDRLVVVRVPVEKGRMSGGARGRRRSRSASTRGSKQVRCFPSARAESLNHCPPALKAADMLMQAGSALTLCIVDLPARTTISPRLLARLRLGAETSGAAVLFITEQTTLAGGRTAGGGYNRRLESLGTFISLQLSITRDTTTAAGAIDVHIAKSKRGCMEQHAIVTLDEPHSMRLDTTV
ncbi:MAG: hypothetical protein KC503_11805 [Myxococcales bacterium]|nr:hypothetical protein [Myxococcales bacterium]